MRIKIIGKERLIAFNGQDGVACPKGSTHDVSDALGAALVRDRWATDISDPTFEQYVAAGYPPASYPPNGCEEVPSEGLTAFRAEQAAVAEAAAKQAVDDAAKQAADDASKAAATAGPSATKVVEPGEAK